MRLSHSYYLASTALVLALPASPVFAHGRHMHHHVAFYRHHHRAHLAAAQRNCTGLFGMQFPCASGAATPVGTVTPAPQPSVASPQYNMFGMFGASSGMAAAQAGASGVPQSLIDRVIARESGGNPRAVSNGNYGLMQIRLSTAWAMGYTGSAAGLLDPQTNMTYAVRYLAGAYRAAGGNEARAITLYSRGYYYQAKAQGFSTYQSGVTNASFTKPAPQFNNLFAYAPSGGAPAVRRTRHHHRLES